MVGRLLSVKWPTTSACIVQREYGPPWLPSGWRWRGTDGRGSRSCGQTGHAGLPEGHELLPTGSVPPTPEERGPERRDPIELCRVLPFQ